MAEAVIKIAPEAIIMLKKFQEEKNLESCSIKISVTQKESCTREKNKCYESHIFMGFQKEDLSKGDNIILINSIIVAIDGRSAFYLEGATLEYHDSGDLQKKGFFFNHPDDSFKCNCAMRFVP